MRAFCAGFFNDMTVSAVREVEGARLHETFEIRSINAVLDADHGLLDCIQRRIVLLHWKADLQGSASTTKGYFSGGKRVFGDDRETEALIRRNCYHVVPYFVLCSPRPCCHGSACCSHNHPSCPRLPEQWKKSDPCATATNCPFSTRQSFPTGSGLPPL